MLQWLPCLVYELFFELLFGCPTANFGPFLRESLTNLMLIPAFTQFQPESHQEPCNKGGSLSLAEHLEGFEPGTFQFK